MAAEGKKEAEEQRKAQEEEEGFREIGERQRKKKERITAVNAGRWAVKFLN
jgi:hypothetical protein